MAVEKSKMLIPLMNIDQPSSPIHQDPSWQYLFRTSILSHFSTICRPKLTSVITIFISKMKMIFFKVSVVDLQFYMVSVIEVHDHLVAPVISAMTL